MQRFGLWLLSLLFFAATPAFADKCVDPIVDEANVLSSADRSNIQQKIDALRSLGAETHVQFLSSYHRNGNNEMMKSLGEYKQFMQGKCSSWKAPDSGFKNNMVLVLVVPKKFTEGSKKGAPFGLFYGSQWSPKLGERFNGILDSMEGNFRDQKWSAGVVSGLTDVVDLIGVKQSQVGKPIVINHSADYSGVWGSAVSWFFGLLFLGFVAFGVVFFLRKKGANDTAQRAAQTERGKCSAYENGFETEFAGLKARIATNSVVSSEWKVRLSDLLDQAEAQQATASAQLSALNRSSNNPDTPRLSQEAYADMAKRYAGVVTVYQEAVRLLKFATSEFEKAKRGELLPNLRNEESPQGRSENEQPRQSRTASVMPPQPRRRTSVPTSGPTVVHHHHHDEGDEVVRQNSDASFTGAVTGALVGTALGEVFSDHHRHDGDYERGVTEGRRTSVNYNNESPVIFDPPAPIEREGGGERTTSFSGDGGGGERIASLSGDGGGGEHGDDAPAPAESDWSSGNNTSY